MITETGMGLDSNRLIGRAISIANARDRYFNDMIKKFREKFPGLKIIYANNMVGAKVNPDHPTPDYILIFKGILASKSDPKLPPREIVMVDAPMLFTDRSIAGWTLCVENGNMDGFFKYMLDKALRIDVDKFYEYIEHMALLSLDPASDLYWRKPENGDKLAKELQELYARYSKRTSNRIDDKRGYSSQPSEHDSK